MKLNIPFEKEIEFETDIYEICSISLEHEITKNKTELLGNFIFEGSYKDSELCINEIPFNFIVPFSVDFNTEVDTNSIQFIIDNFTYDVKEKSILLKIDYIVECDELKKETRDSSEDISVSENINDNNTIELKNNTLLNDDYVTYHVHIIEDNENVDVISNKYSVDVNDILRLNKNVDFSKGNKLLIPIDYE